MIAGRHLGQTERLPAMLGTEVPRTFGAYSEALAVGRGYELLSRERIATSARRSLVGTWDLSLNLLADRGIVHARPLLHLLACFGASALPHEILLQPSTLAKSPLFPRLDARVLWDTVEGLEQAGLILLVDGRVPALRLHPVVREVARHDEALRARGDAYFRLAAELLGPSARSTEPKEPMAWAKWSLFADHCIAILEVPWPEATDKTALAAGIELAGRAAGFLRAAGRQSQASAAFARVLATAVDALGQDDPGTVDIQHEYARLCYDMGYFGQAEALYRTVLAKRTTLFGAQDARTLTTQHYLARTLRARGLLDEAEVLLEQTYRSRTDHLGAGHPDTLTSRQGVADLLRDRGRVAEALAAYREVLVLRTEILGESHPATLVTHQYAAEMCHLLEEWDEAESRLRHVWVLSQEIRGAEHPRSLSCGHSLACLLHDRGRLKEAEALAFDIAQGRWRTLGRDHPATSASRQRLGLIRLDLGAVDHALTDLRAVHSDRLRVLGSDHPDTLQSKRVLEALRRRAGSED